jgi:hypothetical protein
MNNLRGRVLLFVSENVLGQARVLAGEMTATLGLPVSLQVVLRALIEEGLEQRRHPHVSGRIEAHANAVREARRMARAGPRRAAPRPGRGARRPRAAQ